MRVHRHLYPKIVLGVLVIFNGFMAGCSFKPPEVNRRTNPSDLLPRGVSISLGLFASEPFYNYWSLLNEISQTGATHINLAVPIEQRDLSDSYPRMAVPKSTIERVLRQSEELGLSVSLMPLIKLAVRRGGVWRGQLKPQTPELWWNNYRYTLLQIADLTRRHSVKLLFVGAELCSLEGEEEYWSALISQLRGVYQGPLTYSANWDHFEDVPFWGELDAVSVTGYFPVSSDAKQFDRLWSDRIASYESVAGRYGVPLIISEFGYPAVKTAPLRPWDEATKAPLDFLLQRTLVQRAIRVIDKSLSKKNDSSTKGRLRAAFLWNWFGHGGTEDPGFTLRLRPDQPPLKL